MKVNSFFIEFDSIDRDSWDWLRRDLVDLLRKHDIGIVNFQTGLIEDKQLDWISPEDC